MSDQNRVSLNPHDLRTLSLRPPTVYGREEDSLILEMRGNSLVSCFESNGVQVPMSVVKRQGYFVLHDIQRQLGQVSSIEVFDVARIVFKERLWHSMFSCY